MIDQDRSMRRVRLALFVFGVPFATSLAGLASRSAVTQVFPIRPEVFEIVAATTAIGLLVAMLVGWISDRRLLRAQETELLDNASQLRLKRQEIEANQRQHALEFNLKEGELNKEKAIRDERVKIRELEHAIELRATLTGKRATPTAIREESSPSVVTPPTRRRAPASLTRPRRILSDPVEATPAPRNGE